MFTIEKSYLLKAYSYFAPIYDTMSIKYDFLFRTAPVKPFTLVCHFFKVLFEFPSLNTKHTTLIRKKLLLIFFSLQRFQDNGMLHRLKHQHSIKPNPAGTNHDQVTLGGIVPLLSVLIAGICLAFIILFVEKIYSSLGSSIKKWKTVNSRNPKMIKRFNASEKKISTRRKKQVSVKWKRDGFNEFGGYYP